MARFKVTLSTIVSFTAEVVADNEEVAIEQADQLAKEWACYYHKTPSRQSWVDVNDEWQFGEPEVKELEGTS